MCANQNGMGSQSNKQVNNIWQGPGGAGGCDSRLWLLNIMFRERYEWSLCW
ncbi:hypothetical protein ACP5PY_24475 [Photobacterium leiognathi subsp. mandapamensis]